MYFPVQRKIDSIGREWFLDSVIPGPGRIQLRWFHNDEITGERIECYQRIPAHMEMDRVTGKRYWVRGELK